MKTPTIPETEDKQRVRWDVLPRRGHADVHYRHQAHADTGRTPTPPSSEEVAWADRVLAAVPNHRGVLTYAGRMPDAPLLWRAEQKSLDDRHAEAPRFPAGTPSCHPTLGGDAQFRQALACSYEPETTSGGTEFNEA